MKAEWIGEMREVPKLGVFQAGDIIEGPDDVIESLKAQGLCRDYVEVTASPADASGEKKKRG